MWKTITKAERKPTENITKPIKLYRNRSGTTGRVMISLLWLKENGLEDATMATFVNDNERKLLGVSFNSNDLVNGYKVCSRMHNSVRRSINSMRAIEIADQLGYPINVKLGLKQDTDDKNVWIIEKEG